MKKLIYFIVYFLLTNNSISFSQESIFPVSDASWLIHTQTSFGGGHGQMPVTTNYYDTVQILYDTIYQDKKQYKLSNGRYYYMDSLKVYIGSLTKKYVFMDFGLHVNDTFYFPFHYGGFIDSLGQTVKTIDSVYIFNGYRKRITFNQERIAGLGITKNVVWVEGIGDINNGGLIFEYAFLSYYQNFRELNCFEQDGVNIYGNECIVSNNNAYSAENNIRLFPNPTNGILNIFIGDRFESCKVILTDIQGKLIFNTIINSNQPIDISKLNSGIYFLKLMDNKNEYNYKVLKQ